MNKYIKNNFNIIMIIFLLLQPVLDIITGICVNTLKVDITFGVIIRIIMLAFICYTVLFIFKKKKVLIPYILIGIYFVLYTIGMIIYKDSSLLIEIKNLLRSFYYPILLVSIFYVKDEIKISNMTLFTILFFYLIFLFVPVLFGLGYKSYMVTKVGTLGLFNSANEISGIISVLTPIMFIVFYKSKKIIPITILTLMYLAVILMIGTKTPLLSLIITLFVTIVCVWIYWFKTKLYKNIIYSICVCLIGALSIIMILPTTNFYKNIRTHLDYLGLEHVTDIFKDPFLVDHFIFSSRIEFLDSKSEIYLASPLYEKLFGIGYINNNEETKLIEMDYFDIYYSHGTVGFFIYFVIVLSILYICASAYKKKSFEDIMIATSLFLIIFLAFFTGHILTAPSVSILVVIITLSLPERKKKDILFTAYNMDLGGIEKALLTLVNRIDYSKYNVTIIFEEKRGIFLNKINKNVLLKEIKVSTNKDPIIRKTINFTRKLIFRIVYGYSYDFSCCYTTYSYSSGKIALMASDNTAIYVHSDYQTIYPEDNDFYYFFETRNIRDYKHIIFVSNENKKGFIEKYPELQDKCIVLNNFISTEEIIEQSKELKGIKKNKDNILLVFVGRLEDASKKISRQFYLLKEIPELELWIIGDGPDRNKYEKEVKDLKLGKRVTFFGKKENPFPYMREADYIILTSDYEGFPVTYLEALVLNKSIITTIPRSDDLVDISKYGYIVSKNPKEMVKEVKKILKDKTKKEEIDIEKTQDKRLKKLYELFNE